jgi:hypothetical protein
VHWTWCINTRTLVSGLAKYLPLFVTWTYLAMPRTFERVPAPGQSARSAGLANVGPLYVVCYACELIVQIVTSETCHTPNMGIDHATAQGPLTVTFQAMPLGTPDGNPHIHACVNCDTVGHASGQTPYGRLWTWNLAQTVSVSAQNLVFVCTLTFPDFFLYRSRSVH